MAPKFWYLYWRYISSLSTVQYSAKLRNFKNFYLTTQVIVASENDLFHVNPDVKQQQWCKFSLNTGVLLNYCTRIKHIEMVVCLINKKCLCNINKRGAVTHLYIKSIFIIKAKQTVIFRTEIELNVWPPAHKSVNNLNIGHIEFKQIYIKWDIFKKPWWLYEILWVTPKCSQFRCQASILHF